MPATTLFGSASAPGAVTGVLHRRQVRRGAVAGAQARKYTSEPLAWRLGSALRCRLMNRSARSALALRARSQRGTNWSLSRVSRASNPAAVELAGQLLRQVQGHVLLQQALAPVGAVVLAAVARVQLHQEAVRGRGFGGLGRSQ